MSDLVSVSDWLSCNVKIISEGDECIIRGFNIFSKLVIYTYGKLECLPNVILLLTINESSKVYWSIIA